MRSLRRTSKKQALRTMPQVAPQVVENIDNPEAETHSEPLGHVHDNYRHWVWLGLHHRDG